MGLLKYRFICPSSAFSSGSGVEMMSDPMAAPPMMMNSDGWFSASSEPPCMR